jgi:hypothetical protein
MLVSCESQVMSVLRVSYNMLFILPNISQILNLQQLQRCSSERRGSTIHNFLYSMINDEVAPSIVGTSMNHNVYSLNVSRRPPFNSSWRIDNFIAFKFYSNAAPAPCWIYMRNSNIYSTVRKPNGILGNRPWWWWGDSRLWGVGFCLLYTGIMRGKWLIRDRIWWWSVVVCKSTIMVGRISMFREVVCKRDQLHQQAWF